MARNCIRCGAQREVFVKFFLLVKSYCYTCYIETRPAAIEMKREIKRLRREGVATGDLSAFATGVLTASKSKSLLPSDFAAWGLNRKTKAASERIKNAAAHIQEANRIRAKEEQDRTIAIQNNNRREAEFHACIAAIQSGQIPVTDSPIPLHRGEVCHLSNYCLLAETEIVSYYVGVDLGGIWIGGTEHETHFSYTQGTYLLTNHRVIFIGGGESVVYGLDEILDATPVTHNGRNGFAIVCENDPGISVAILVEDPRHAIIACEMVKKLIQLNC